MNHINIKPTDAMYEITLETIEQNIIDDHIIFRVKSDINLRDNCKYLLQLNDSPDILMCDHVTPSTFHGFTQIFKFKILHNLAHKNKHS